MKLYYVLLLLAFPLSAQINVVPQPNEVHYYKGSCKVDTPITYVKDPTIANPEGYQLVIQPRKIIIKYSADAGKYYATQTLRQLIFQAKKEHKASLPCLTITDAPRFAYRALMVDPARHYWKIEDLKKYIDVMSQYKFNYLHLHLNDDQGWRIEIKKYPKLTEIGAKRTDFEGSKRNNEGFYTQEEMKDLVRYALECNVQLIPEFDMPGHNDAAVAAYPFLSCNDTIIGVRTTAGVSKNLLCVSKKEVFTFIDDVISELSDVFPCKYFHIGGDEAPTTRWKECPRCKALSQSTGVSTEQLQGVFTNRIEKFVNSKGKSIIGWDEILHGKINPSAVIMSWTGVNPGLKAASTGHDVIMTPGEFAYFDHYQTENHSSEPDAIGGLLPVEKVYSFNPLPDSVSVEARKHIIGVQANLWTEYIPYQTQVEYMLLPRLAALSEVQWVPAKNKKYDEFHKRATQLSKLYDRYGYTYALHMWPERYQHNRSDW